MTQNQFHDIGVARQLGYTVCWIERRQGRDGPRGTLASYRKKPDYHFVTAAELAGAMDDRAIDMLPPSRR